MFEINLSEKLVKYYCIIMFVQRYIREQINFGTINAILRDNQ